MAVDVQAILALAQERAAEAVQKRTQAKTQTAKSNEPDPAVAERKAQRDCEREERNATVLRLWQEHGKVAPIKSETGISHNTIVKILTEAEVYNPKRRRTQEEVQAIAALFAEGKDVAAVVEQTGEDEAYVKSVARRLGITGVGERHRLDPAKLPTVMERALKLEQYAGVSLFTIAQRLQSFKDELNPKEQTEDGDNAEGESATPSE